MSRENAKSFEAECFEKLEKAIDEIASKIDYFESIDDFQLVDLYEEIEDLDTNSSFMRVSNAMFLMSENDCEPDREYVIELVRRYDRLTKHHPTNAYKRFRKISDDMQNKCIAVNAVRRAFAERAISGAKAKNENDPKQIAKQAANALWLERHKGKHAKLKTNEQFATEVMRRWPVLTSSKVICGWAAAWGKEVRTKKNTDLQ
jgi:uncharacterized protein YoxC